MTTTAPSAPSKSLRRRPEILAPVGTEDMLTSAIENGADAVYFGLQEFNARLRAANFRRQDLPRVMQRLHERGMRGYVTLNTLVFEDELTDLAETLIACSDAGVDAILVQDVGVAWLANQLVPGLPVHASTQMTVTSAESITALERLGLQLDRIVAARELNRRELGKITAVTDKEVEVFVHGAICVAYSGQCLTSEALGGRSANRGECAQACRLPYDLIVDGEPRDVGGLKYLLSPKDLAAWEDIGDLMDIGIVSLKIEGRLKSPEYVAATVRSYRAAVDTALAGEPLVMPESVRRPLEMTFSRGFTGGYLHETNHQNVVEGRFPKKRGLRVGTVVDFVGGGVVVEATGPIKPGDGLVFDSGQPDREEEGGRVYEMEHDGLRINGWDPLTDGPGPVRLTLRFGSGQVRTRRMKEGELVWKTSDPALEAELKATWTGDQIRSHRPVDAVVSGSVGAPLVLELRDEDGVTVRVEDTLPADRAEKRPLGEEVLREQLGRLGNTPFELRGVTLQLDGDLMVPKSRLNELRRRAAEKLIEARRQRGSGRPVVESARAHIMPIPAIVDPYPPTASELSVLCRSLAQVEAAVAFGQIANIYTDFEDIRLHREARKLIPAGGPRFVPAGLRIVKPGEAPLVRKLLDAEPDALLIRNLASWVIAQELAPDLEILGDYSLNVSNHLTARLLFEKGISQLVPSYDLNIDQLMGLLTMDPLGNYEVTIHQYMPMFHMEHCVFCRFLSTGTDFTNCGRPCESHEVALKDRMGYEHYLKADAGCRNTVFNATAQSASAYIDRLVFEAKVRRFRVDFVRETAEQATEAMAGYLPVIRGEADGSELWRTLRASSKLGVTKGSLDHD
ncbi:U32 family peptidase [bacterium]|nr:U32 family peptidase [bacterium]